MGVKKLKVMQMVALFKVKMEDLEEQMDNLHLMLKLQNSKKVVFLVELEK
jgi:hypothetical protein